MLVLPCENKFHKNLLSAIGDWRCNGIQTKTQATEKKLREDSKK